MRPYAIQQTAYKNRGFTMVELMIVLAIMAILLALAGPSFTGLIRDNRNSTATNTLMVTLSNARSEAVRRGQAVTVCPSADGVACSADWSEGWIAFTDDSIGAAAPVIDTMIQVEAAMTDSTLTQTAGQNWVRFSSRGMIEGAAVAIDIKPSTCNAGTKFRDVRVNAAGQISTTKSTC